MKLVEGGNIFLSGCDRIVIPVNCHGIFGAGLAKQARVRHPELCAEFATLCHDNYEFVVPGKVYPSTGHLLFATTKDHWRYPSQWRWITEINRSLAIRVGNTDFSYAIPALGCGLGGLEWEPVLADLEHWFHDDDRVVVYAPRKVT